LIFHQVTAILRAMRNLFRLIKTEPTLFVLALVALAIGSGINLVLPAVIREFLNASPAQYLSEKPFFTAGVLTLLFGAQCVAFYYRSLLFNVLGQRIVTRLRRRLFSSLIEQPIAFFDTHRVGDLISRLGADTMLIQDAISIKLSVFVRYSFQVVVGVIMMMTLSLKLTATIVLVVPVLIGFAIFLGKKLKRLSKEQQAALGAATGVAEESLAAARIIRAFNQEETFAARYQRCAENVLTIGIRRSTVASFFSSFVSFLMNISIVFILLYGISLVFANTLTIGDLTAFMLYGVIVAVSFAFVGSGFTEFIQAMGAGERIFEFIDGDPAGEKPVSASSNSASLPAFNNSITFSNISFAYPSRPEELVLTGLTLNIAAGKTTALVGPSGAGKSTIVALLLGFYPTQEGQILVDGKVLDQNQIRLLRQSFAVVPQEPQLFALSIAENLRLGNQDASNEQLRAVCQKARILDFIDTLEKSFETEVGERGVLLSAGQKQRLAIARALLRDPKVLILDEATSALDSENEHLVQEALEQIMKERTVLVIAHRLATVKNADTVLVLEEGKLLESGTHLELVKQGGLYHQLVERQDLRLN